MAFEEMDVTCRCGAKMDYSGDDTLFWCDSCRMTYEMAFDTWYPDGEEKVAEIVAGKTPDTLLGFPVVESDFLDLPKGVPIVRYGVYVDEEE